MLPLDLLPTDNLREDAFPMDCARGSINLQYADTCAVIPFTLGNTSIRSLVSLFGSSTKRP